jgi:hypothetical protein
MGFRPDSRLFKFVNPVEHSRGFFNAQGQFDAANAALVRLVGEKLAKEFAGVPWAVTAEVEHGIVKVAVQGFTQWPYVVKVDRLKGDPGLRAIREAGGHLLERLKIGREKFHLADWQAANQARPWVFNRLKQAPV